MRTTGKWAIVQHSGFAFGGRPGLARAVEPREVPTRAQENQVINAGGVLFASREEAEEFTMKANYPEGGVSGLYPAAEGTFGPLMIGGLRIYLPVREG